MNKILENKSVIEDTEMSIEERSNYLRSIPWIKEHFNELKSIDKGCIFYKFKRNDTEVSMIPVYNDRKNYYVVVHTMNNTVKKFMERKFFIEPDKFGQNYFIRYKTFAKSVSSFINIVREIRDKVLCDINKEDNNSFEENDKYSISGIKLTREEIKDRLDKICVKNSPVIYTVGRDGVIFASSNKIKYGAPSIKMVPRSSGYDLDVFIDGNLNYLIRDDLLNYIIETLRMKRLYDGSFKEHYNNSFNVAYNKFRDISTDIIVFILNHEVFKNSVKSKRRKR